MKKTQHSGCFIFLIELDWLNFALGTGADFHWLNDEQLIFGCFALCKYWYRQLFLRLNKYSHSLFDEQYS